MLTTIQKTLACKLTIAPFLKMDQEESQVANDRPIQEKIDGLKEKVLNTLGLKSLRFFIRDASTHDYYSPATPW